MRLIWSVALVWLVFGEILAQQSYADQQDVISDQYIIRIEPNIRNRMSESQLFANLPDGFSFRQIMATPFNLWLVTALDKRAPDLSAMLRSTPGVQSVIPNRQLYVRSVPDDPFFANQWQYFNDGSTGGVAGADMEMTRAWDMTTGGITASGDTIVICVIDDGINIHHADLKNNVWVNRNEVPDNGIDDDENGYIDDYYGWNVETQSDSLITSANHGSSVSGIIGATGNNGIGVSGVNWNVKILSINYGLATEADAIEAYAYAYTMRKLYNETNGQKGAYIVATNASWGVDKIKAEEAPLWCELFDALGAIGIINVAATTNSNTNVDELGDLPTSCTSEFLITVTNLNKSDRKMTGAGYGRKSIDLGAYGHQVYTVTAGGYGTFGGTSGASPHVTGMAGLLYSVPCLTFDSIAQINYAGAALIVKDMILHSVIRLPDLEGQTTTGGKLNAYRSVKNMSTICTGNTPPAGITIEPLNESLVVSWLVGSEPTIALRYRKADEFDWVIINNFSNGDTIQGLLHCTEYEIQLGSQLGMLPGAFSYSKFITTKGCCTNPTISNITSDQSTIAFDWETSTPATLILNYVLYGQQDTIEYVAEQNHFELTNLPVCTALLLRVQAHCTTYDNYSGIIDNLLISTSCDDCTEQNYCSFGKKDASFEWINSFSIGEDTMHSGSSLLGFSNFAGTTTFHLAAGSTHDFEIFPGYKGAPFADNFRIYIDYNHDGTLSEAEKVFTTDQPKSGNIKGQITIPTDAILGYTRLRLMMVYEDFEGSCDNREFQYGEIEDYCVLIKDNCNEAIELKLLATGNHSAVFTFDHLHVPTDSLQFQWKHHTATEWNTVSVSDSIYLESLEKCTLYDYRYIVNCDGKSTYIAPIDTFRTMCSGSQDNYSHTFRLYPNPVGDYLILESGQYLSNQLDLQLMDITGNPVECTSLLMSDEAIRVNTRHLIPGFYFLRIEHRPTAQSSILRFIKW